MTSLIENAKLKRQNYGIAMAQTTFGGPTGIWLECTGCTESQVIVGSNSDEWMAVSDADCAKVFLRHGWSGEGVNLKKAKCPRCTQKEN